MLRHLSIRDIVLIEALDLDFSGGLNVLTGETGAGKSILLDALGFALGRRARRNLVRPGADQGSVTAEFELPADHPVAAALATHDLAKFDGDLILRRVAGADGRARGFVNDQRVSGAVLAEIGDRLVEVHGQQDDRGLLDARGHAGLLDAVAGAEDHAAAVRAAWIDWQGALGQLGDAEAALETAAADADYLRHAAAELDELSPEAGEDDALDAERRLIRQAASLGEEMSRAAEALSPAAEGALGDALSRLTRIADRAEGRLDRAVAAIDRTMAELGEAERSLADAIEALRFDSGRLEVVEERLFALRRLARKHGVRPDELPALADEIAERLAGIDQGAGRIAGLDAAVRDAERVYRQAAAELSAIRRAAANRLDHAVTEELRPLRMENARFVTEIVEGTPGPEGIDKVRFTAAINPGAPAGPIDRIASGGELSRFLLALKVQLAARSAGLTMIFDEIDRGVGGATADAVGRRLSRLAGGSQVLVVTHSPQVAAVGDHHFLIEKFAGTSRAHTDVVRLDADRREAEIARMLAGNRVTDEARAAARALLAGSR